MRNCFFLSFPSSLFISPSCLCHLLLTFCVRRARSPTMTARNCMALQRIAGRGRNKVIWNRNLVVAGGATSLPMTAPGCGWCGEEHKTREHMCPAEGRTARKGQTCKHVTAKYASCCGPNFSQANVCAEEREARLGAKGAKGWRSPPPPNAGGGGLRPPRLLRKGPRVPWRRRGVRWGSKRGPSPLQRRWRGRGGGEDQAGCIFPLFRSLSSFPLSGGLGERRSGSPTRTTW